MNERTHFVFAVIIALIVPVMIGSFYLKDLYEQKGNSNYVYKIGTRDLLLVGDDKIRGTQLSSSPIVIDFQVNYADGEEIYETYELNLENIKVSNMKNEQIKWILSMYDSEKDEYFDISTGTIDEEEIDSIDLKSDISIALDMAQSFRFQCFLLNDDNGSIRGSLNADIVLE